MKSKEQFKVILLNDTYIKWLHNFMKDINEFDNKDFILDTNKELNNNDYEMIDYLEYLYKELKIYYSKNVELPLSSFCLKYKNYYYIIKNYSDIYYCGKYDVPLYMDKYTEKLSTVRDSTFIMHFPTVEYNDIKKQYELEDVAKSKDINTTPLQVLINKIMDNPQKFYIDIYNNLTPEEKLFIIENLENKNCFNCTNGNCKVETNDKLGLDEDNNPKGYKCVSWKNDLLVGKSKVLKIKDINKLN